MVSSFRRRLNKWTSNAFWLTASFFQIKSWISLRETIFFELSKTWKIWNSFAVSLPADTLPRFRVNVLKQTEISWTPLTEISISAFRLLISLFTFAENSSLRIGFPKKSIAPLLRHSAIVSSVLSSATITKGRPWKRFNRESRIFSSSKSTSEITNQGSVSGAHSRARSASSNSPKLLKKRRTNLFRKKDR